MTALETIEIETAPNPGATILVLHGLGADGNDFVPIANELSLDAIGPVRFVFPHAPVMPVTINNGYRMRAWYDILGTDLVRREDEAGLRASAAAIEALLAKEKDRGMPAPGRGLRRGARAGLVRFWWSVDGPPAPADAKGDTKPRRSQIQPWKPDGQSAG